MHARGTVVPPIPPAFKLDDDDLNNHWHVKGVLLKEVPISGVRLYDSLRRWEDEHGDTWAFVDMYSFPILVPAMRWLWSMNIQVTVGAALGGTG